MKRRHFILTLLAVLTINSSAQAQHPNNARGFQPNGVYSTKDIDSINLFNGNLQLNIPIANSFQTAGGFSYSLGYKRLHESDSAEPGESVNAADDAVTYTRDGSYLRMVITAAGRSIEFPDGTTHKFQFASSEWRLVRIEDRFGNFLAINYDSDVDGNGALDWVLSDSTGRTHTIYLQKAPGISQPFIKKVDLAAFNRQRAQYLFNYATPTIQRTS